MHDSKAKRGPGFPPISPENIPHRIRDIAMLRGLGYSFREIAQQLNVTPQAVSLMLARHRRALTTLKGSMELSRLSARAVNALGRHGVSTVAQAREKNVLALLSGERNCGRKTLEEIGRWMNHKTSVNGASAPHNSN